MHIKNIIYIILTVGFLSTFCVCNVVFLILKGSDINYQWGFGISSAVISIICFVVGGFHLHCFRHSSEQYCISTILGSINIIFGILLTVTWIVFDITFQPPFTSYPFIQFLIYFTVPGVILCINMIILCFPCLWPD